MADDAADIPKDNDAAPGDAVTSPFSVRTITFSPDPLKSLSLPLQLLVKREVEISTELFDAYEQIKKDAAEGKAVTAKDFLTAEDRYHKKITPLDTKLTLLSTLSGDPNALMNYHAAVAAEIPSLEGLDNTTALNRHFKKYVVAPAAHRENTQIDNATDEPGLLKEILSKNRGFAIGDIHTQDETSRLLTANMKMLKESGVDTIYLEFPPEHFERMNILSAPELRQLAKDGKYGDHSLPNAEEIAGLYNVAKADDSWAGVIEMAAAAKENDIRVVMIDKRGKAKDFEADYSMAHRIASTNYVWSENIESDRKTLAENGKGNRKFIVFGGLGHFTNDGHVHGMVDEALGVPVVAFDRRPKDALPVFTREQSPGAADYYLRGGDDYLATGKMARAEDVQVITSIIKPLEFVPGVSGVIDRLEAVNKKTWEEINGQQRPAPPDTPDIPLPPIVEMPRLPSFPPQKSDSPKR